MRFGRFLVCVFMMSYGVSSAPDDYASEIMYTYKNRGIEKTKELLDEYLTDRDFWMHYLKYVDTKYGYYEDMKHVFLSNKSVPNLSLYEIADNQLVHIMETDAIVGKGGGAKQKEGDLITPIGVYRFTGKLTKLDDYYGPFALATNYPNVYDKALLRTGHGIWIHGKPRDGRVDSKTRGCIVVDNDELIEYERSLESIDKSVLITYEDELPDVSKDDLATLLASLYEWKDAWEKSDVSRYLSYYSGEFRKVGMDHSAYVQYKRKIFSKNERKSIQIGDINISPYPNDQNKRMFLISFTQNYRAYKGAHISYSSIGSKELYVVLEPESDKFSIVTEM